MRAAVTAAEGVGGSERGAAQQALASASSRSARLWSISEATWPTRRPHFGRLGRPAGRPLGGTPPDCEPRAGLSATQRGDAARGRCGCARRGSYADRWVWSACTLAVLHTLALPSPAPPALPALPTLSPSLPPVSLPLYTFIFPPFLCPCADRPSPHILPSLLLYRFQYSPPPCRPPSPSPPFTTSPSFFHPSPPPPPPPPPLPPPHYFCSLSLSLSIPPPPIPTLSLSSSTLPNTHARAHSRSRAYPLSWRPPTHTHTMTCTYVRAHARTNTHTHAQAHAHSHAHVQARARIRLLLPPSHTHSLARTSAAPVARGASGAHTEPTPHRQPARR